MTNISGPNERATPLVDFNVGQVECLLVGLPLFILPVATATLDARLDFGPIHFGRLLVLSLQIIVRLPAMCIGVCVLGAQAAPQPTHLSNVTSASLMPLGG